MKKEFLILIISIILLVALIAAFLLLFPFEQREAQQLLEDRAPSEAVVYEDIAAAYQYKAKLEADGKKISDATHIDYNSELSHCLKITEYIGAKQTFGLSVYINGIPQRIRINGEDTQVYTFDPIKEQELTFSVVPQSCKAGTNKVSVVLIAELDAQPLYYLDSISNFSHSITYWMDNAPAQETTPLPQVVSEKQNQATDIIAENTAVSAVISDKAGFSTQKFISQDEVNHLYLNMYGKRGTYIVTAYCNNRIYNAFDGSSSILVTLEKNELASVEMSLPENTEDSMRKVFCVIIPTNNNDALVYDSVMLNLLHDSKMLADANSMSMHWDVEADDTLTQDELNIRLTTEIASVRRTYRVLALINGLPQKIQYEGNVSESLSFGSDITSLSFAIVPNMDCEYDKSFRVDIVLLQDGSDNVLSEDYMMDYAFLNEVKTLRVKNKNRKFECSEGSIKNEGNFFKTASDTFEQSLIIPKDAGNYQKAFCNYFLTTESKINMSCLLSLPEVPDGTEYLSFVVVNNQMLNCFEGKTFFQWTIDTRNAVFDFEANLQKGLNKIYVVTLFQNEGRLQRIVSRATVNYCDGYQPSDDFAVSYAFNTTEAVFAFKVLTNVPYHASVYTYGFNFNENYITNLQSSSRNSKFESSVSGEATIQVNTFSLNTGTITIDSQDGETFSFAKYQVYGYTN